MKTQFLPYNNVREFYESLVKALQEAKDCISMMYFTFDDGQWARKISEVLRGKVQEGVKVRLTVDKVGLALDNPVNLRRNNSLMKDLSSFGVQVTLYQPKNWLVHSFSRLHCKMCAVDEQIVFIGGSNIGDYYLKWRDSNLCLKGEFGGVFHEIHDYLVCFSHQGTPKKAQPEKIKRFYEGGLRVGKIKVLLTVPGQHYDFYDSLLNLILGAQKELYLQTWYFLPDKKIFEALMGRLKEGTKVKIMISQYGRYPLPVVNIINRFPIKKLARAGAEIYSYHSAFLHTKVYWNDNSSVLIGSANLSKFELNKHCELCLGVKDQGLAGKLKDFFHQDKSKSLLVTPHLGLGLKTPAKVAKSHLP